MDAEDPNEETQYHLEISAGDIEGPVLLPGNPERVPKIASTWDEQETVATHREFRTMRGSYRESPLSCTSTGIGGPSAGIAVEELARAGADRFIRVGSCGAIQPDVEVGDLVITSAAVRQEGTSDEYVRPSYPAAADYRIVSALVAAAEQLEVPYHLGVTCSTDSFYPGQSRRGFDGYEHPDADRRLEELQQAGVINFEMETATICALAALFGLQAGAVCTVYANRTTGEFRTEGERRAGEVASLAASILSEMDQLVADSGADRWHAGLSLSH